MVHIYFVTVWLSQNKSDKYVHRIIFNYNHFVETAAVLQLKEFDSHVQY